MTTIADTVLAERRMPRRWVRPTADLRRALLTLSCLFLGATSSLDAIEIRDARLKMGSRFEITAIHDDEARCRIAIDAAYAEIDRIEALISSWRESSQTSEINRQAASGPVRVSTELLALIRRSIKISKLTNGAFDITFAGAGQLWDFKASEPALPDPAAIREALSRVDYQLIRLDSERSTVELPRPGMRIGFGGIGKGYAANRAVTALKERGIQGGVVDAGGDLMTFGHKEDGSPWTIAIADPLKQDGVFAWLRISDQAVVTSGDYESYIEVGGVRYAHILDPRTGYPVRDVRSVTIICPDAELADALATGVFALGRDKGLELLNKLNGIEGLVVDPDGRIHVSSNLMSFSKWEDAS